ncbi:hypothetical protein [Chitinolyticbacter meiyuanensis]|uniref:hypothetical protein n=1 Tax=Chitinolyticbacter meiyuanensis TaxID=682798 RepID=UPI0011E5C091|nr:hypothetical protein [Chitinolyticbacter meiyuanensis]
MIIKRTLALLLAVSSLLLTTGCAQLVMGPPQSSLDNTMRLRAAKVSPANVGEFKPAEGLPAGKDQSFSLRGANSLKAPTDGSFTQYLRASLIEELKAANSFDPASQATITGTLLDTDLDPAIGTGSAMLSARVIVTKDGEQRFAKDFTAQSSWDSSFIGAVAIPLAANNYEGLFRKFIGLLLEDEAFLAALR